MTDESVMRIPKFIRIDPDALKECVNGDECLVTGPAEFVATLKPGFGVVEASWNQDTQLGEVLRLGVVLRKGAEGAVVQWVSVDLLYRPNPAGRRYWSQTKPFFGFAAEVAERYMLAATFAEHFAGLTIRSASVSPRLRAEPRPSDNPTGGYVYLIRSAYGIKIGKSVNVKSRTRLFEVKLPFPITVEHYAWFEDYSFAERDLHRQYHAKRLEGEWFDLSAADVETIKKLGVPVPPQNL